MVVCQPSCLCCNTDWSVNAKLRGLLPSYAGMLLTAQCNRADWAVSMASLRDISLTAQCNRADWAVSMASLRDISLTAQCILWDAAQLADILLLAQPCSVVWLTASNQNSTTEELDSMLMMNQSSFKPSPGRGCCTVLTVSKPASTTEKQSVLMPITSHLVSNSHLQGRRRSGVPPLLTVGQPCNFTSVL